MPDIADRVTRARTRLLVDSPWFGSLALRLRVEPDPSVETMCTDGTTLRYSPSWTETLTDPEIMGVVAHEVMHCALLHPFRMQGRDHHRWNVACDYAINALLIKEGFKLPAGMLDDAQYHDLPAEVIYARLPADIPDETGPGEMTPGATAGESSSAEGGPGGDAMTATDWQIASEQATMVAKRAGALPGDVDRLTKEAGESRTDWQTILRRFVEQTVPSDYSWTSPNRRYVAQGIYLPGTVKENMPVLGIAVDTSGSIDARMLASFAAEITMICQECHPERVDVVYCDTEVHHPESFTPDDEIVLGAHGGGGTMFQPALDWFSNQDEPPAAVIYLTDLDAGAPIEPDYPVLWVTPMSSRYPAPFGELVRI